MNIHEIKENFWLGTQQYLQFLVDNGLGTEKIEVSSVVLVDDKTFILKTKNRIFDECGLEFLVRDKRYTLKQIRILKNDKRRNTLLVEISKELKEEFSTLKNTEIIIISDLKFLVSRVLNWYDKFGETIKIPEDSPKIPPPLCYPEKITPSECQKEAIEVIFSQPMSYVWGAPGTGKTAYVLANSILNYIFSDENGVILLVAPTNLALEQTLVSLLPILEENGISLDKVSRLGQASRGFYGKFPQVCENTSLNYDLYDAIHILENLNIYIKLKEKIEQETDIKEKNTLEKSCKALEKIYDMCDFSDVFSEIEKYSKKVKELKKEALTLKIENELLVVACTVDTYIGRNLNMVFKKSKRGIAHIFLDEACCLNVVKGLTLFACDCPITFLGDHMQLPPVCEMPDLQFIKPENRNAFIWAQSSIYTENVFYEDMEDMLAEYIRNTPPRFDYIKKTDLNFTHRFGSGLAEVLEKYVYNNRFMSAIYDETKITCINVRGNYSNANRENIAEAKAISEYIRKNEPDDYIVLTPYRNQQRVLLDILKKNVMTVHKSQGQEWDTVILSVTDTKNMYFTDSQNYESKGLMLINTAVSRAKKELVIVCDEVYWKKMEGQLITSLIEISEIKNNIFTD